MTLTLFDLARHTDPESSKGTAREITRSGTRTDQCMRVLAALRAHPGLTSAELANHMHVDRVLPARRLPDLLDQGLVRKGVQRACTICRTRSGEPRKCDTWWAIVQNSS